MDKMTPTYNNNTEIYEGYRAPAKFIRFEGNIYKFESTARKADAAIHSYHCEAERHTLKIHLQNGIPFYVEGIYKIAS